MASAVLVSRNEGCFVERKTYMRNYQNLNPNPNPNQTNSFISLDPNPTHKQHNPNRNHIHDPHYTPNFGSRKPVHPKETTNGNYITFKLSSYTPRELKTLKKRLITELEHVRNLKTRLETLSQLDQPALQTSRKRPDPFKKPGQKKTQADSGMEKLVKNTMKRCAQILGKIMKHKFSWVFNQAVDVAGMGLFDYYEIIKRPMDLGAVKRNLEKGVYKCPSEFGSDVRLTFDNAMMYNPKDHDVHVMARHLLEVFDQLFCPAFNKFQAEKLQVSKRVMAEQNVILIKENASCGELGREESLVDLDGVNVVGSEVNRLDGGNVGGGGRGGKLRKPKAREVNKRVMSYEEKAKLGREIEELPEEKMVLLFQIVRRRNGFFAQDGDEIELDMEAMDNETLWELDRFVGNFKKMVSKNNRQGCIQEIDQNQAPVLIENLNGPVAASELVDAGAKGAVEEDVDIGEEIPIGNFTSVEIEKDVNICDGGRSGSSSGADSSGSSSSSDSDSGSSSDSDSDAGSVKSPYVESNEDQTRERMN